MPNFDLQNSLMRLPSTVAAKLDDAYEQAEATTKAYSKSFYLATSMLPRADRRAVRALYGFCRYTDNLVDDPQTIPFSDLGWWQQEVNQCWQDQTNPLLMAWAHTREYWHVPQQYGNELIEGCEMDLTLSRYETWADLAHYCYCVASTVGLMAMHIFGTATHVDYEDAKPYAVKLGIALQLTNILRNVGEDAARGRIYLPQEDMAMFGITDEDIIRGELSEPMQRLLKYEIERAYHLYEEAWPGIQFLAEKARFSVAVAVDVYRGILEKIIANHYNVFTQRAFLTKAEKMRRLPLIWFRMQRGSLSW